MKYKEQTQHRGQIIMSVIGCFTVVSGVILALFWPQIFDTILFKQIALHPGSKSYGYWKSPPQPLYLDIYLFNWTNPHEFTNKSIKPKFNEIGPFRFQEVPQKVNVTWHEDNSTVSYRKQSRYFFIPEASKGKLDDVITSVNVIALSTANHAKHWSWLKAKGVSMGFSLYNEKVHVTKNASEWLFDGYEDPLINLAKGNPLLDETEIPPFDRFGWFYMRNNSNSLLGDFNANTGVDNIKEIGQIRTWNHVPKSNYYEGKCGELTGSAGDFFTPLITKNQTLQLFSPEMCRSVLMDFEEEQKILGIRTLKFSGGDRTVDNGTLYPENECFCGGECVPSGLFNISSCRYGTPVFMSFPHFYNADPFYLDQVEGMNPDKKKHQFFMSFEPKTAIPLEVAARFQINLLIEPISTITIFQRVQKKFMPILWFEQHVQMNDEIADEVKLILKLPHIGQMMGVLLILIGSIQIMFMPLKNYLSRRCCLKHSKISDLSVGVIHVGSDPPPEISPLISTEISEKSSEKSKNSNSLMENIQPTYFENNNSTLKCTHNISS